MHIAIQFYVIISRLAPINPGRQDRLEFFSPQPGPRVLGIGGSMTLITHLGIYVHTCITSGIGTRACGQPCAFTSAYSFFSFLLSRWPVITRAGCRVPRQEPVSLRKSLGHSEIICFGGSMYVHTCSKPIMGYNKWCEVFFLEYTLYVSGQKKD